MIKWPGKIAKEKDKQFRIPARIRFKLWFGLEDTESNWLRNHFDEDKNGALLSYAETVSIIFEYFHF